MFNAEELKQRLLAEGYEERPYGYRKKVGSQNENIQSQMAVILPHKHTGMGYPLNEFGLRERLPEVLWEVVYHCGYANGEESGSDLDSSLLYKFQDNKGRVDTRTYRQEDLFRSLSDERGRWHILMNTSNRPIKLQIYWKEE